METLNNMASAANKAIWGEQSNQEPVSGEQGDPSKGEPYDAGNKREEQSDNPSEAKDSSAQPDDSTKEQNDTRSPSDPDTNPTTSEAKSNVDDSGSGPNPTDPKGPGPKPIVEVAKEHGGDAGNSGKDGKVTEGDDGGDDEDDDDDGPQKKSHGEGTGEKYVKSTGLKADGGDFDAANPGAGREADRLLEEKGMHNPTDPSSQPQPGADDNANGSGDKPKMSLGDKIKSKLHKNTMS